MGILRSEGFAALVESVASEAAARATVAEAVEHAASLAGRVPVEIGLRALTRPEEHLFAAARAARAELRAEPGSGERLVLTRTGRARLLFGDQENSDQENSDQENDDQENDGHPVGYVHWPNGRPTGLAAELARLSTRDFDEAVDIRDWLAGLPRTRVDAMIEKIRFSLLHMAPVQLYTGTAHYGNLGKSSNLVGKSVRPDSDRCRLKSLAETEITDWDVRDACFLACLHALISSGPAVRAEEFSGTQLRPDRLLAFLRRKIDDYRVGRPPIDGLPTGQALQLLAETCAEGRATATAAGARPYRVIQGLNLNKRETLAHDPVTIADVPTAVVRAAARELDCPIPADFAELRTAFEAAMPALNGSGADGFSTRFEQVLHELVMVGTEAIGSDVGMSRGPRRIGELAAMVAADSPEAMEWTTTAFYCCVTPSRGFVEHFAAAADELPQVLRAISARMRYNGWHYLPHTIGMHERADERDWFFAPTMSDLTDWSDQHHTGHVANGVRYAIRVPFGVAMAGEHRPGMFDFRLMRAFGEPYTLDDLRAGTAVGELLRCLYQARVDAFADGAADPGILDFDNPWYQARYSSTLATAR
ncbi:hypothetical protein [Actinokineospora enzanensis]|uniref:hypothetical protein n=1 Tax=Actinokineospora enzanensis TaxID=155975 RepID=UPI000367F9B8|nr:hypothetical protein [Actinokineospora enzanensis]